MSVSAVGIWVKGGETWIYEWVFVAIRTHFVESPQQVQTLLSRTLQTQMNECEQYETRANPQAEPPDPTKIRCINIKQNIKTY